MKQDVVKRKLTLCPSTQKMEVSDLIVTCPHCDCFVLYCCACNNARIYDEESDDEDEDNPRRPCHHYRLVFTDGACLNNGQPGAKAGAGVALGTDELAQWQIPITSAEDDFPLRTSQRAELFAAIQGVRIMIQADQLNKETSQEKKADATQYRIVATDSEYVCKGVTQWLPAWKRNKWRTSKGTKPANLDLFMTLDREIGELEAANIKIGFWHVPRKYNAIADGLAKEAAKLGDVATLST